MAERLVKCVKFGKELPGLEEPPWEGDLGKRIYENVSQEAWKLWLEHLKMLINEYRLNPATAEAQKLIADQMEQFFFGEGAKLPPGFVPQQKKG
ncbi:MAG: oxidative damage protection protein [Acidobacteria bacterium]|nr:MAG: oxidative damage protection protein [Acidobacteriota bacterium]